MEPADAPLASGAFATRVVVPGSDSVVAFARLAFFRAPEGGLASASIGGGSPAASSLAWADASRPLTSRAARVAVFLTRFAL